MTTTTETQTIERKLTIQQQIFADSIIKGLNQTDSARKANYKGNDNTLWMTGSRLIRNDKVKAYIEQKQAQIAEKLEITIEKVLRDIELARTMALEKSDIAGMLRASELEGKHLAMFSDVHLDRTPEQQAEYDEDRRREAIRLSNLTLRAG